MGDTVTRWLATWPTDDPDLTDDDRYEFVLHAPLTRPLRNVEVTLEHRRASERLDDLFDCDVATWWRFAGWSSAQVGTFIRARLFGHARLTRALSVGNTRVYSDTMPVAMGLVRGEPPVHEMPDASVVPSRDTFLQFAQALAERVYRAAIDEPDRRRRGELVMLGNLCLLAHEQELLEVPLAVAARSHVRRAWGSSLLHPTWSQRQWRSAVPPPRVLSVENWVAARVLKIRPLVMPWGTIKIRDGVPGFVMPDPWPAMPGGLEAWHPFLAFPPSGAAPDCYLCLDQRLSFLYALLVANGDATTWPTRWEHPWKRLDAERIRAQGRHLQRHHGPPGDVPPLPAGLVLDDDRHRAVDDHLATPDPFIGVQAKIDLRRARALYRQNRHWVAIALLTRSLPATFAAADGAGLLAPRVHGVTIGHRAEQDIRSMAGDAATRSARTLEFLDALFRSTDDGFGDKARSAIEQTRRRHHLYRADLVEKAGSHERARRLLDDQGTPINVIDTVGTAVAFVVPVKRFFDAYAPHRVPDQGDWDAWARTWARIAEMIGAPHEAVVISDGTRERYLDCAAMTAVGEHIDARCAAPNLAGVYLLANLVRDLEDAVPAVQRRLVRWAMSVYGDERHTRLLLVPVSPLHRAARRTLTDVGARRWSSVAMDAAVRLAMGSVLSRLEGLEDAAKHELPLDRVFPADCSTTLISASGAAPARRGRPASRRSAPSRSTAS